VQEAETTAHLCLNCSFAKELWHLVLSWANLTFQNTQADEHEIQAWWAMALKPHSFKKQRSVVAILIVTAAWNIWNERNRRIFDNKFLQPVQVFGLIKADLLQRVVWRPVEGLSFLTIHVSVSSAFL
jgi:hypothetical protein